MDRWLNDLVAPLNTVLFHFGQDAVTWAELLGFVTGAVGVRLTVRAHIWNFPIGIANNVFFLVLFWTARLYADASLQIVYLVLGLIGWWEWLHGGERRGARVMARARAPLLISLLMLIVPARFSVIVSVTLTSVPSAGLNGAKVKVWVHLVPCGPKLSVWVTVPADAAVAQAIRAAAVRPILLDLFMRAGLRNFAR